RKFFIQFHNLLSKPSCSFFPDSCLLYIASRLSSDIRVLVCSSPSTLQLSSYTFLVNSSAFWYSPSSPYSYAKLFSDVSVAGCSSPCTLQRSSYAFLVNLSAF